MAKINWTTHQLNNRYYHFCQECSEKRDIMDDQLDIMPDEQVDDLGLDVYVHYIVNGTTLCGN